MLWNGRGRQPIHAPDDRRRSRCAQQSIPSDDHLRHAIRRGHFEDHLRGYLVEVSAVASQHLQSPTCSRSWVCISRARRRLLVFCYLTSVHPCTALPHASNVAWMKFGRKLPASATVVCTLSPEVPGFWPSICIMHDFYRYMRMSDAVVCNGAHQFARKNCALDERERVLWLVDGTDRLGVDCQYVDRHCRLW